jgi:pimeloyl-ACP methyl ester carboxylesterase
MTIARGFVDIPGGQIHYRRAGAAGPPLVMIHASPGSSKQLERLIGAFAATRLVFAPDTLGNGDSTPPAEAQPTIESLAAGALAALDGLGLERVDLYGTHTGASIAATIALVQPTRVRRLVLDGVGLYDPDEQASILAGYLPEIPIDHQGLHALWTWQFCRDTYLFWPWFRHDRAGVRDVGLPSADALHDKYVEVIKAYRSFRGSYRAAFLFDKRSRLPRLAVPTLAVCARDDMLFRYLDELGRLIPGGLCREIPGVGSAAAVAETAARIGAFLDEPA